MTDAAPRRRLLAALLAALVTGAAILLVVQFVLLPLLACSLTDRQVTWFASAVAEHPARVMAGVFGVSVLLSLPVLLVALAVYRGGRRGTR